MNARMDARACRELGAATNVLRARAQALNLTAGALDGVFVEFIRALGEIPGRIVVVGAGASDCVARHTAQLFSSLGTPALYMAPEMFWDSAAWIFAPGDAVLAFSDGDSPHFLENAALVASRREVPLFVIAGQDEALPPGVRQALKVPGCAMSTSQEPFVSPLVRMALGDALALGLMRHKGVDASMYRESAPLGGGRFRRVSDIMRKGAELPLLQADATLAQARALLRKYAPCVVGVLKKDRLAGVISDADFRRIGNRVGLDAPVAKAMRAPNATLREDCVVAEALRLLRESGAPALFVLRERRPVGMVGPYDCLRA